MGSCGIIKVYMPFQFSKYNSYTFDASRTGIENFSNLRTLTINCE